MKITKLELGSPDEVETVYYEAFMHCDVSVMAALWALGDVVCIHPGSAMISGHQSVVRSWSHIFKGASPPQLEYKVLKRTLSQDLAVHIVSETVGSEDNAALVLATNIYQKFDTGWLMLGHHASLIQTQHQGKSLQ